MAQMLINAQQQPDQIRVAIVSGSTLVDLDIDVPEHRQMKANIYKGKISSIEPSLGAVFVDFGREKHGFLAIKDISREYFLTDISHPKDSDIPKLFKLGQELVVQIKKEETGTKGAALTTFISLAGAYTVLMPNNPRAGGVSRRIEGEDRELMRERLGKVNIPDGMRFILRTAGVNKSAEELQWDLDLLLRYWDAIYKAAVMKPAPYLIHEEGDVLVRAVRDYLREDVKEIIIDEQVAFERVQSYIQLVRPDFPQEEIKLYQDALPLFSRYGVEEQIEIAHQREIRLPSGGSIVIDYAEALIAVDVNSARATKGRSIEETALNTNLEAADVVARYLRICDVGGLIVIDFIDMNESHNRRAVKDRIDKAVTADRARIQTASTISRFGLMEMSRQRLRTALNKTTQEPCPRCHGRGTIRSVESLGLALLNLIQEKSSKAVEGEIHAQLPPDIAAYLLNEKRHVLNTIFEVTKIKTIIIPNQYFERPNYEIKLVTTERSMRTTSYQLIKPPRQDNQTGSNKPLLGQVTEEPAINEFLSTPKDGPPIARRRTENSLIKRLWNTLFGSDGSPASEAATSAPRQDSRSRQGGDRSRRQQSQRRDSRDNYSDRPNSNRRPSGSDSRRNSRGSERNSNERSTSEHNSNERSSNQRSGNAGQRDQQRHPRPDRRPSPNRGEDTPRSNFRERADNRRDSRPDNFGNRAPANAPNREFNQSKNAGYDPFPMDAAFMKDDKPKAPRDTRNETPKAPIEPPKTPPAPKPAAKQDLSDLGKSLPTSTMEQVKSAGSGQSQAVELQEIKRTELASKKYEAPTSSPLESHASTLEQVGKRANHED